MKDKRRKETEYFVRLIRCSMPKYPRLKIEIKYESANQCDEKTIGSFIKTYLEGVEKALKTDISFLYVKRTRTWINRL